MAYLYELKLVNNLEKEEKIFPEVMAFIADCCGGNVHDKNLQTTSALSSGKIKEICSLAQRELGCQIELYCV
jgi:hypothetical protein